jgi:hypothetical protein
MQFGHEQLDVYQVSIRYVAWAYEVAKSLGDFSKKVTILLVFSPACRVAQRVT